MKTNRLGYQQLFSSEIRLIKTQIGSLYKIFLNSQNVQIHLFFPGLFFSEIKRLINWTQKLQLTTSFLTVRHLNRQVVSSKKISKFNFQGIEVTKAAELSC